MTPAALPLTVQRWAPFVEAAFAFEGFDFSAATFEMQVRSYRDAEGDPLIDLIGATAGTEGISCVVTVDADDVSTSWLTVQIDEVTINAVLPFVVTGGVPNRKANTDVSLYYDLKITGGGYPKTRWAQGSFTIEAGVSQ